MQVKIFKDHQSLSENVASEVVALLNSKPEAVICFASGETPRQTCRQLVEKIRNEKTDTSRCSFIGLDEWVGIPPENEGSCHYFFKNELIEPLGIPTQQFHLFDAMSDQLGEECLKMDRLIAEKKGIDLIIVGIGMNGHIGFNEPGVSFTNYSHIIDLDEITRTVGQKYFKTQQILEKGITLGLQHLLDSRKAILIANGNKKASVIKKTIEEQITNDFPASIMQSHPNGFVMIDEEAAADLDQRN
ncbi:MAG TPA: glucosamine-6-phosphate deaminase [Chitinophagaceae bacterium]|nr:glucosamine-6-phosphate deaminase [Chitinophagaceae bacterium]HUM66791.1 glucosamine-6-phosphate deaminase [Chitinophagaceae bacterium]